MKKGIVILALAVALVGWLAIDAQAWGWYGGFSTGGFGIRFGYGGCYRPYNYWCGPPTYYYAPVRPYYGSYCYPTYRPYYYYRPPYHSWYRYPHTYRHGRHGHKGYDYYGSRAKMGCRPLPYGCRPLR